MYTINYGTHIYFNGEQVGRIVLEGNDYVVHLTRNFPPARFSSYKKAAGWVKSFR